MLLQSDEKKIQSYSNANEHIDADRNLWKSDMNCANNVPYSKGFKSTMYWHWFMKIN